MLKTLTLSPKLESALNSGHPWLYRNHLPEHRLQTRDWVRVQAGRASRIGLFDSEGAIALRLYDTDAPPDRTWLEAQVKSALALRSYISENTDAYRLINGENDALPGIVADRYGRYVVIKTYAESVNELLSEVVRALQRFLDKSVRLKGIVRRSAAGLDRLWGELPPPEVTVYENGLAFIANLYEGQKTGLFLDQRENRQTVRGLAAGKSVLNLFSYNGGFSVYALAGGAARVRSVDIAEAANRDAERNAALGNFAGEHEAVSADVFELLKIYADRGERFDMVILDPPSLAKDKDSRRAAERAYRRLNRLAFRVVAPGGLLVSSSCTARVPPDTFKTVLREAARDARVNAQIIHEAAHALDHPVRLAFPEGRYLKFVIMRCGE